MRKFAPLKISRYTVSVVWSPFSHVLLCSTKQRPQRNLQYALIYADVKINLILHSCSQASQHYIPAIEPERCSSRQYSCILSRSHWNTATELPVAVEAIWAGWWAGWVEEPLWWGKYISIDGSPGVQCRLLSVCGLQLCWEQHFTLCQAHCW